MLPTSSSLTKKFHFCCPCSDEMFIPNICTILPCSTAPPLLSSSHNLLSLASNTPGNHTGNPELHPLESPSTGEPRGSLFNHFRLKKGQRMERLNWSCRRWKVWDSPRAEVGLCHFLGQTLKYRPGTTSVFHTACSGAVHQSCCQPTDPSTITKASALPSIAIPFLQAPLTSGEAKPPRQNSFLFPRHHPGH